MKNYLPSLLLVCLLTACSEATSSPTNPLDGIKADDLEIVTLTESSRGDSLYFDVIVKNNSDQTAASASVKFNLLNNDRVVDSGSAFYEDLRPGQASSQKAAFYDVLEDLGAYTCYQYEVTVISNEDGGGAGSSETKSYDGTCN